MSKEGYLQIKIQDLNEQIKTLEGKEKSLSLKYDKLEDFLNNEINIVLENIEDIKKTKQEIKELPEKAFSYIKENLDKIIQIKFNTEWEKVIKSLKETFVTQSKINANEFNQMAKRYIADNSHFEITLGSIMGVLLNKKIMTLDELNKCRLNYKRKVKPLIKKDLICGDTVTGDLKNIDKILGTDFESEELIRENKKILEDI